MIRVERATTWEQVEVAAAYSKRCIKAADEEREAGNNWAKAKETWETLGDKVIYFLLQEPDYPRTPHGYVRLFNVSPDGYMGRQTYVVDYMWPQEPDALVLILDQLPGSIFVKSFFNNQPLTRHWVKVDVSLAVPDAPYRVANETFTSWMLVVP